MSHVRKIAHMRDRACTPNVAAQFIWIAFAHENSAVVSKRTGGAMFSDFPRRAIVVTNLVGRAQRINARRKMQGRDLLVAVEFQIMGRDWAFARCNHSRVTAASAGRKQKDYQNVEKLRR